MATEQYLDADGLAVVASKVNEKLKVVATMPATPTSGQVVLYVGTTTADYTQGGIYLYNGTAWVLISTADVDLTPYKKIFTGTRAEWELLTTAEKKAYDEADLTDDLAGGELIVSDTVTDGDLNPVTSNAVYDRILKKEAITFTPSSGVTVERQNCYKMGTHYHLEFTLAFNSELSGRITAGSLSESVGSNKVCAFVTPVGTTPQSAMYGIATALFSGNLFYIGDYTSGSGYKTAWICYDIDV